MLGILTRLLIANGFARGAGALATLALDSGGTHTRTGEGSYLTGAPTDGSSAFLAWAATDVRRIENRGDGLGPGYLSEGARTNHVLRSRELDHAAWSTGLGTTTANAGPGPDGTTVADRSAIASGNYGNTQGTASPGSSVPYVISSWQRRYTGTGAGGITTSNGSANVSTAASLTTTYQRIEAKHTSVGAGTTYINPSDGRAPPAGPAATALDVLIDLNQLEAGSFPSSAIRTTTAAGTRGADALSYATGDYPAAFLAAGFVVDFAPDFTQAEFIAAATTRVLVHNGSGDYLALVLDGGACKVRLAHGGNTITSGAITFSRAQKLTITAKPTAGSLTVALATTGNGTTTGTVGAWDAAQTLWIGSDNAGASCAFGRFLGGTGGLLTEAA